VTKRLNIAALKEQVSPHMNLTIIFLTF